MDIEQLFEKHDNEYLKFDGVKNKLSTRPDLHAFLMLDKLFPGTDDMVCAAGHDIFYLGIGSEMINKLTEDQVIELARCGVLYQEDSLAMFT